VTDRPEGVPVPGIPASVVAGAGWHPDPAGRFPFRWWDGRAWTAFVGGDHGDDVTWDPAFPDASASAPEPAAERRGVAVAVAGFALGGALSVAAAHRLPDDASLAATLVVPSLALWLGLGGACVVAHRRYGTGSFARDLQLRFRWIDLAFGLVGSIAGRLLTASAASPVPLPSTRLRDVHRASEQLTDGGAWLALALVICVGAPLFEELLFRGLLQPRLVARFGPVAGIAVASALFGGAHLLGWSGPTTFVTAWSVGAAGLALGVLRHHSGRLGPSMLAHALYTAQVVLVLALNR
jgi:membrane protease YdiL (CAAX protease family)